MLKLPAAALLISAAFFIPSTASSAATDFAFEPAISQRAVEDMPLLDIARAGDRLVAAGEKGLIILSDDDGKSWRQTAAPVSTTLTALSFTDEKHGWAVGHAGTILSTSDGGQSWTVQFDGRQAAKQFLAHTQAEVLRMQETLDSARDSGGEVDQVALDDLQYALEDAEYAVEDAEKALETGPADPFLGVLMLDSRTGFAVGAYGMIYRTGDGGENWELSISGIENVERFHYYAMAADDSGRLYLSGEAGLLYVSQDGGENWQRTEGLYDGSLFGLVTQGDAVITFGLRGNIFRSTDQGENWTAVDSGQSYSLYGGKVLSNGEILLVGAAGQVLTSTDGGQSYSSWNHPARATLSSGIVLDGAGYYLIGMGGIEAVTQLGATND